MIFLLTNYMNGIIHDRNLVLCGGDKVMKYFRRRAVATSSDRSKFPKCYECGNKEISMPYREDKKLICHECIRKDENVEWIDWKIKEEGYDLYSRNHRR